MKKHFIYVTIEEFLSNGGVLEKDREIFIIHDQGYGYNQVGEYLKKDDATNCHLAYNATYKSFPITEHVHFVKIEADPIWK